MARKRAKVIGRCVLLFSATASCVAAPISYRFSGNGSGTIDAASFTNKPYVITLTGDTTAIDYAYSALGEFRNAVTGIIQINGRRSAAVTIPITITTACGAGGGYVGIEKAPATPAPPFPTYIYNAGVHQTPFASSIGPRRQAGYLQR